MEPLRRIEVQRRFIERGFPSIKDWAKSRGFSLWLVYKVLEGKALSGKKGSRIAEALREDLGLDLLKLHEHTSSGRFSQDIGQSRKVKQKTRGKIASRRNED